MTTDFTITGLDALEILDSRGRPTVQVTASLGSGHVGVAGVPSGASTGTREVVELRDGDPARYGGMGVRLAADHVSHELLTAVVGRSFTGLASVDEAFVTADGTSTMARLGANGIVGASMAVARAVAALRGEALWQTLDPQAPRLPVPHFNVVNGGAHAANGLDFQEFMIAPVGAPSFAEAVRAGSEVYAALRRLLAASGHEVGLGDEGGFAPQIGEPEAVLDLLVQAITDAGYIPGRAGVAIALDPAASEFHDELGYLVAGEALTSTELIERYEQLIAHFPIWSIEDGWARTTGTVGRR